MIAIERPLGQLYRRNANSTVRKVRRTFFEDLNVYRDKKKAKLKIPLIAGISCVLGTLISYTLFNLIDECSFLTALGYNTLGVAIGEIKDIKDYRKLCKKHKQTSQAVKDMLLDKELMNKFMNICNRFMQIKTTQLMQKKAQQGLAKGTPIADSK